MQESKDKVMPSKTIVVKAETYQALDAWKIVPRDPFDCVIKRLLDQKKFTTLARIADAYEDPRARPANPNAYPARGTKKRGCLKIFAEYQ